MGYVHTGEPTAGGPISIWRKVLVALSAGWAFIRPENLQPEPDFDPTDPSAFNDVGERLNIKGIFLIFWGGRRLILFCVLAGMVVAAFAVFHAPETYDASMYVTPSIATSDSESTQSGGLSSLMQSGSLLGLLSSSATPQQFQIFQSMIKSPQVAEELDRRYGVAKKIFSDSWDSKRQVWRRPPSVLGWLKGILYGAFGLPSWTPPNAAQLAAYIGASIQVIPDGTNVYRLDYEYPDPAFAQWFLGKVVAVADAKTLEISKKLMRAQLQHLQDSLRSTTGVEFRQAMANAFVSKQYQSLMAVEGQPFAITIVSPPAVDPLPISPRPLLFLAAGAILGALLGVIILYIGRLVRL